MTQNNGNETYDSIKNRLLQMGYNKTDVINRISLYNGSGKSAEFVFKQLIHTFTDDTKPKPTEDNWKDNYNSTNTAPPLALVPLSPMPEPSDSDNDNSNINYNSQYVDFENSYYVSVNCHICKTHFTDIYKYRDHIKQHYIKDANKTWRTCEFVGCSLKTKDDMHFIRHLATHISGNKPFKCNVIIHGNKCDISKGYKPDMKIHWKSHFTLTDNKKQTDEYIYKAEDSSVSEMDIENNNSNYIQFENSYNISVRCHICKMHFKNINKYKFHMKNHYTHDPNKTWGECDFECKSKPYTHRGDSQQFVDHIHTHTKSRPFVCNVLINAMKCGMTYRTKDLMKNHWMRHFNKSKNNIKLWNNVKFEDSYSVSVHCHICRQYFNQFDEYKYHLKKHYQNDANATWKQCNLGCKINPKKPLFFSDDTFISHISQHFPNEKPFKCNVVKNGKRCPSECGSRTNMREHWQNKHFNMKSKENKPKKKLKNKNSFELEYIPFENSFHVSVNCHICKKHFNDFDEYKFHLFKHYKNDPNKKWKYCDFKCTKESFRDNGSFINHLLSHSKTKPFICNVLINGNKCGVSFRNKCGIKTHWQGHFKKRKVWNKSLKCKRIKVEKKKYKSRYSDSESSYFSSSSGSYSSSYSSSDYSTSSCGTYSSSDSYSVSDTESDSCENSKKRGKYKRQKRNKKVIKKEKDTTDYTQFENDWCFSMKCHICKEQVNVFGQYRTHMKRHFNENNSKNKYWMQCDFGCVKDNLPVVSKTFGNYIAHTCMHTNQKPWKCDVNGEECDYRYTTKAQLKGHWKSVHYKENMD